MGRVGERVKKKRRKYLGKLANEDPDKFTIELNKRLESWAALAAHRAKASSVKELAFEMVTYVNNELLECGAIAQAVAKEIMIEACCAAVAYAYDGRMHNLTIRKENNPRIHIERLLRLYSDREQKP